MRSKETCPKCGTLCCGTDGTWCMFEQNKKAMLAKGLKPVEDENHKTPKVIEIVQAFGAAYEVALTRTAYRRCGYHAQVWVHPEVHERVEIVSEMICWPQLRGKAPDKLVKKITDWNLLRQIIARINSAAGTYSRYREWPTLEELAQIFGGEFAYHGVKHRAGQPTLIRFHGKWHELNRASAETVLAIRKLEPRPGTRRTGPRNVHGHVIMVANQWLADHPT